MNIIIIIPLVFVLALAQSSDPNTLISYLGPMIGNKKDVVPLSLLLDPNFTFSMCNGKSYDNVGSVKTLSGLHVPDAKYILENTQNIGNGNEVNITIQVKAGSYKVGTLELTAEPSNANPSGYILLSGNQVC